ncbi:MAG: cell surface protein [Candidatus Moranbacteria bacterium GW2011_GWE1_35_17]|nr:MAG: cell surface protein [Candidatus Moranbacteria bacterium GW2011_GWE1_35_17]KKP84708.1 MAG: cell surface protein [Candidatus Moranbacteria bacterium GW2011_GWF2_35_54]
MRAMKIKIILMIFAFSTLLFVPVAMAEICGGTITIQIGPSSYGGTYNDPEPTSSDSDPDLHINSFDLREIGGSWVKEIYKTLYWGQSFQVEGRMEVENRSSQEAKNVDADYRIENKRDFDENDTKIDEDSSFDIDPGEREDKTMSPVTITVSPNGQTVTVSRGSTAKGFPINGFAKIYFFVDVEEDDGDQDISSESDKDEYGKVELTIRPPIIANFSASVFSGTNPLTVSFTDHSTNNPTSWNWNFGDGYSSSEKNPTHTYLSLGIFTVRLTANNSLGTDSVTKVAYITVSTPPLPPPEPEATTPMIISVTLIE